MLHRRHGEATHAARGGWSKRRWRGGVEQGTARHGWAQLNVGQGTAEGPSKKTGSLRPVLSRAPDPSLVIGHGVFS